MLLRETPAAANPAAVFNTRWSNFCETEETLEEAGIPDPSGAAAQGEDGAE